MYYNFVVRRSLDFYGRCVVINWTKYYNIVHLCKLCFIFQVHPLALCNDGVDDALLEYGWVGVVKLEKPEVDPLPCLTLYEKVGCKKIIFLFVPIYCLLLSNTMSTRSFEYYS